MFNCALKSRQDRWHHNATASHVEELVASQKKQVATATQTLSLYFNLGLPSSVNNKLQRDKRRAGKLIQGSHCETQTHVGSPSLSSPQPDGNSQLWHCHNFASLLHHSLFFPPPLSCHSRRAEVIACDTRERKKGKENIALRHKAECHRSRMSCISWCLITVELFKIEAAAAAEYTLYLDWD